MKFLIPDLIKFVFGTMVAFSQGGAAKIKSKQFSEFGSLTKVSEGACLYYINTIIILPISPIKN